MAEEPKQEKIAAFSKEKAGLLSGIKRFFSS
jgi:hypothetical protein